MLLSTRVHSKIAVVPHRDDQKEVGGEARGGREEVKPIGHGSMLDPFDSQALRGLIPPGLRSCEAASRILIYISSRPGFSPLLSPIPGSPRFPLPDAAPLYQGHPDATVGKEPPLRVDTDHPTVAPSSPACRTESSPFV